MPIRSIPTTTVASVFHALLLLVLFQPLYTAAQEKGVHFEHALSWADVKAKAKAANKYIFVDCYTTWCGPCMYMRTVVFPQEEMGTYLNDKFINVELQLDSTAKDDDYVKSWYADAHDFITQYKFTVYPTYLIFTPEGHVLHRFVGASTRNQYFYNDVNAAFDTTQQYYPQLEQFEKGRRDTAFLRRLTEQALKIYQTTDGKKVAAVYLAGQTNLLQPGPIRIIDLLTTKSTDEYFSFLAQHINEADQVIGAGKTAKKIRNIYLQEGTGLKKGESSTPDWRSIQKKVATHLPDQAGEIAMRIKINYYNTKKDWPNFEKAIAPYMKQYAQYMRIDELNNFAWNVFEYCADMTCVTHILDWSIQLKNSNNSAYMDTYANILYKLGKKDEAMAMEKKAFDMSEGDERTNYQATLDKMTKGEKNWR